MGLSLPVSVDPAETRAQKDEGGCHLEGGRWPAQAQPVS